MHDQDQTRPVPPPHWSPPGPPPPPPGPPYPPLRVGWRQLSGVVRACLIVVAVLGLGGATMGTLGYVTGQQTHTRDAHQITELRTQNKALAKAEAKDHYNIGQDQVSLNGLGDVVKPFTQFNTTCSQFFANGTTGQPATYQIPCKPASSGNSSTG